MFLIDAFKALAAQLIVLHHLAWYGPMSDVAAALLPLAKGQNWLAEYGRYAVAAFLAIGGYLAAQGLKPHGLPNGKSPLCLVMQRYARLVGPYAVALIIAVASASIARHWMTHDSIGSAPQLGQFFAHLFLLHDMLEYEALSAGVWYVAIDFQLYALLVLLLWLTGIMFGRRPAGADFFLGPLLVAGVALASLFFFNLNPDWDHTALYFFGAYALGVGSRWAVDSARPHAALLLVAAIGAAALALDFRPRIAIALLVALSLGLAQLHMRMSGVGVLSSLSRTSYSLFLVHFPVCLLISAAFQHFAPASPALNAVGLLAAWLASNLAAAFFYRHVEIRMAPWLSRWITCRRPAYSG
jgi:peptidoglycan/LPS O-acetylase OafA/YrhL